MPHAQCHVDSLHSRTADALRRTLLAAFTQRCLYASAGQVEDNISKAHSEGKRIRVVGNALSPNGIGLSEDTMLSLGQCDRVLHVDKRARTVTVEVRLLLFQGICGAKQGGMEHRVRTCD